MKLTESALELLELEGRREVAGGARRGDASVGGLLEREVGADTGEVSAVRETG